jgi:DNA-binding MarR family transcriptional regulator
MVTARYDGALAKAGLTTTQYALLVRIGRAEETLTHNKLANEMGMDRTTLTRTLAPLTRKRWVEALAGKDRRERRLRLTLEGASVVTGAYAHWAAAQQAAVEVLGSKKWGKLRKLLRKFEEDAR